MAETRSATSPDTAAPDRLQGLVQELFAELFGIAPEEVALDATFLEMGADSLFLLRASQAVQQRLGVRVPFRRLLEELSTVSVLAAHLAEHLGDEAPGPPRRPAAVPVPAAPPAPAEPLPAPPAAPADTPGISPGLKAILAEQLRLMSQQLELLRGRGAGAARPAAPAEPVAPSQSAAGPAPASPAAAAAPAVPRRPVYVAFQPLDRSAGGQLTTRQREHLDALMERLSRRTARSKEMTQACRRVLANNRASAGFRLLWKEVVYPLIGHCAAGSHIWDVDGNEYVDLTMGYGSLLFGHSPQFLRDALKETVDLGIQVGPESEIAGRAAELICRITGSERATFCNSGTEAVMIALRLARAATGRPRIAVFAGSYHGTFDGVLAKGALGADGRLRPVPLAPGIPPRMVEDVLMLDYDSFDSLQVIEEHAHELAAVLVEPRQSRRPDLDRREFLHRLRELTERTGVALIFDEVVTGFRMHPGGVQALYGVRADITTYGKAVANGMPIGVVAGKAAYLDGVDGGYWSYGDRSIPEADTTFFAGTFFRHPLVMAAVLAVLNELERRPGLQEELGRRTGELVGELNAFFDGEGLPIRVVHFGSLFTFTFPAEWTWSDLFFYHLLERGIYVWERRICYLSTAHSVEDVRRVVDAVRESIRDMRRGGFLPDGAPDGPGRGTRFEAGEGPRELPLTEAQKELWALAQLGDDASVAYNLATALRLRGPLRVDALRRAAQTVVERHEALRVTLDSLGRHQRVAPRLNVDLPVDWLDEGDPAAEMRKEAGIPFDLSRGPLFRLRLLRLGSEDHVLLLTVHHVVSDGHSLGVVLREISELYGAEIAGRPCRLPAPTPFGDYVRHVTGGGAAAQAEGYWLERFAGPPPALDLPADRPRRPEPSFAGEVRTLILDEPLSAGLKETARRLGCTTFMLLLSAVQVLLHRLSGQDDLVIGVPAAGQPTFGGCLVGYCINLLPLRLGLPAGASFADCVRATRSTLLDAYEHQGYPFSRLTRALGLSRDPGRPPLVSALFNLDHAASLEMAGLSVELLPNPAPAAQVDVEWNVTESERGFTVDFLFNRDLFDAETAERWLGYLRRLLAAAVANPAGRADAIDLMGSEERRQVLVEWNRSELDVPLDRCFHELFAEQAQRHPGAVAAQDGEMEVTYAQLARHADELARTLVSLGVGLGGVVALLAERGADFLTAMLATFVAGGAYLPLDPQHPAERQRQVLERSGARWLLASGRLLPGLEGAVAGTAPGLRPVVLGLEETLRWPAPDVALPAVSPDDLAYVIYTSGSTGVPKGAMITHRGMLNHLWAKVADLGLDAGDVVAQTASQCFDISVWQFLSPLLVGGRVRIYGDDLVQQGVELFERVNADGVTILEAVPSLLRGVLPELRRRPAGRPGLAALRWLLLTGESLPPELCGPWLDLYPAVPLLNAYGPTECSDDVAHHPLREAPPAEAPRVPIGRPVANTRLYVVDRALQPVAGGARGELCVGGTGVGRGYLNDPARTAAAFVPDPFSPTPGDRMYRTGDLARWLPGGEIDFLGRIDHQVKVRGFRIELGEIEAALEQHPGVHQAVVLARDDAPGERRLVGYVVAAGAAPAAEDLRGHLRQRLPEYMVPPVFVFVDAIPLTPNGKIDRRALPPPAPAQAEARRRPSPPVTPREMLLADIWKQLLGLEAIGVHDNFFELGGDSILAIQLIARAREGGLRLIPRQVFERPTVAGLAEVAEAAAGAGAADQGLVTGPVPLTPIQRWFVAQELPNPHHWNMAMLHEPLRRLDPAALERAVGELLRHHDGLRLRFERRADGSWSQRNAGLEGPVPFSLVDLTAEPKESRQAAVQAAAALLQESLDLSRGPLLRAAYFDFGAGETGRLLLVIHHLAVDVVSWQVLLEDLETAYRRAELPAKTTSFQEWSRRLDEQAQSDLAHEELGYWLTSLRRQVSPLPADFPGGANRESSAQVVSCSLGAEETRALLRDLPKVYRTQVSEALLTALALGFGEWTGESTLLVDLEGHGREPLFDGVDLSRTSGWFTSMYPVLLDVTEAEDPGVALKGVKEQLRAVPRSGVGFGILRYLSRRPGVAAQLAALPQAEVSFNYEGRLDGPRDGREPWLRPSADPRGASRGPAGRRSHLLEIDGYVADGRLQMHWLFSEAVHRRSTVEALAGGFLRALRRILEHAASHQAGGFTPSDFPKARLKQAELDKLVARLGSTSGKRA